MIVASIHGIVLAFSLILPLGAQNVFVFNQGVIHRNFLHALPVVITAAICDTILITLAVLGVSLIILESYILKLILMGVGIIFLIYMGWSTWVAVPNIMDNANATDDTDDANDTNDANETNETKETAYFPYRQILFAASISLFNPHAIMDTVGVIGTSSMAYEGITRTVFMILTIIVSWIWFFSLAFTGRVIGKLDKSGRILSRINKLSAIIMWGVAGFLLFTLIETL